MKRIRLFLLMIMIVMLIALYGCSSSTLDQYTESDEVVDMLEGADGDYALSTGTTMPSETLIDDDGSLLVRVTGLGGNLNGPHVCLAFDKGNNRTLAMDIDYVIVNGWQVSGSVSAPSDVYSLFQNYAGRMKRFSGYMVANTTTLYECGLLNDVWSIEFAYVITVDPADISGNKIYEGVYSATTTAEEETEEYVCNGQMLLDAEDVTVQLFSLENGSTSSGNETGELILHMENHSDRRIALAVDDLEQNGEPVFLTGSSTNLIAGGKRLFDMEFGSLTEHVVLEEGGELSFTLNLYDYDEYAAYDPDDEESVAPAPLAGEAISLTVGEN